MCIGKLVLGPDAFFFDMSLDRNRKRLYGNGLRLDVSNPQAMKATALPKLGPIVVDPTSGRYATTEAPGYGENIRTLFIFNPDDTLYDSQPLPGLPFAMDVDPANGLFFVTTRQDDQQDRLRQRRRPYLCERRRAAPRLFVSERAAGPRDQVMAMQGRPFHRMMGP